MRSESGDFTGVYIDLLTELAKIANFRRLIKIILNNKIIPDIQSIGTSPDFFRLLIYKDPIGKLGLWYLWTCDLALRPFAKLIHDFFSFRVNKVDGYQDACKFNL